MANTTRNTTTAVCFLAVLSVIVAYLLMESAFALPSGAVIIFNQTAGIPTTTPDNRNDSRGTITTLILRGVQQDQSWKGYVGNITGKLTLDDAVGNTIYNWPLSLTKIGKVYLSRSNSPSWLNVTCGNQTYIDNEQGYYGMAVVASDNINSTFNTTNHQRFLVGPNPIAVNTCRATSTFINNVSQTPNGNQLFQEILLQDPTHLIFTTMINASTAGFDGRQYDFQIIVPESPVNSSTPYYFYTELG